MGASIPACWCWWRKGCMEPVACARCYRSGYFSEQTSRRSRRRTCQNPPMTSPCHGRRGSGWRRARLLQRSQVRRPSTSWSGVGTSKFAKERMASRASWIGKLRSIWSRRASTPKEVQRLCRPDCTLRNSELRARTKSRLKQKLTRDIEAENIKRQANLALFI